VNDDQVTKFIEYIDAINEELNFLHLVMIDFRSRIKKLEEIENENRKKIS
jgi:hypothetical protein